MISSAAVWIMITFRFRTVMHDFDIKLQCWGRCKLTFGKDMMHDFQLLILECEGVKIDSELV